MNRRRTNNWEARIGVEMCSWSCRDTVRFPSVGSSKLLMVGDHMVSHLTDSDYGETGSFSALMSLIL